MITLAPISGNIQNTLNEKISMLKKGEGKTEGGVFVPNFEIGSPVTDGNRLPKNYMMTRVPFFRMTSFTPKKETTNVPIVIMGGELSPLGRLRSGFADRKADVNTQISSDGKLNYHGLYHQYGDIPYRPIAGVKDIAIEYKGGGMRLGATRTGTINWNCWTWEDLTELTPHFLQYGKTVLLEWGWIGDGALKDVELFPLFEPDTFKFDMDKITNLNENILLHTEKQKGHYDAMLGLVQKFDWSVNESGGFNCNTSIISPGVTLLQKHHKKFASSQMGSLPVLSTQTQNKIERWWWWDTDAEYKFADKGKNMAKLAPYITFREYMQDFPDQVKSFIESKIDIAAAPDERIYNKRWLWDMTKNQALYEGGTLSSNCIDNGIGDKVVVSQNMEGWYNYEVKTREEVVSDDNTMPIREYSDFLDKKAKEFWAENVMVKKASPAMTKVMGSLTAGNNVYVTWGWFEDNVLSRFFGNVDEEGKLIGEFRSIESLVGDDGSRLLYNPGGDEGYRQWGKPVMQSTRMTNSKYLITVDGAKWLIPNRGDPVIQHTAFFFGGKSIFLNALTSNVTGQKRTLQQEVVAEGEGATKILNETGLKMYLKDINRATDTYMPIRNILFNASYLSTKLAETTDLLSGVLSIWNEFSSIYGGVYRFKLDYDDDSNRMLLREEGYTNYKVKDLLESKKEKDSGEAPVSGLSKLFEFPIMEAGSIVKSQTITAKLPDRMQLAAMYGVSDSKESADEKSEGTYDDIAAAAWGRINQKPSKAGTLAAEEQKRYRDLLSGTIDYPSRGNRSFGNTTANEQSSIHAELLSLGKESEASAKDGTMKIYPSILDEIETQQKEELIRRQKLARGAPDADDSDTEIDGTKIEARAQLLQSHFRKINSLGTNSIRDWSQLYNWNSLGIKNIKTTALQSVEVQYGTWGHPKIKSEALVTMNKLLRGGDDSVLDHIDPLIPIDFEMEIDGTGGMFPGNSFHSSYVSKRYQEESLFQMVGVSHAISSEGWSTTIKGQIRAVAKQDRSQNLTSGGGNSSDPLTNLDVNNIDSIKAFQRAVGLVDDGIIGPITQRKIDELIDLAKNDAIVEHNAHPRVQDDHNEGTGDESAAKPTPILVEIHRMQRGIRILLTASDAGEYHPGVKQNVKVFGAGVRNVDMGNTLVNVASEHGVTAAELKEWNPELWGVWTGEREGFPIPDSGNISVIVGWK